MSRGTLSEADQRMFVAAVGLCLHALKLAITATRADVQAVRIDVMFSQPRRRNSHVRGGGGRGPPPVSHRRASALRDDRRTQAGGSQRWRMGRAGFFALLVLVGVVALSVSSAQASHLNWKPAKGKTKQSLLSAAKRFVPVPREDLGALVTRGCSPGCEDGTKRKRAKFGIVCGFAKGGKKPVGGIFKETKKGWRHIAPSRYKKVEPQRRFFRDAQWLICDDDAKYV